MFDPKTYGTAELLRAFLSRQFMNLEPENGYVRLVVSDFSIETIIELFRNNNASGSTFDVNSYSWCIVESQWGPEFNELAALIPNFSQVGPYQSLTEARNDPSLSKPALLLAPPLSNERESLKDLQHLNHSTIFDYFPEYEWIDQLVEILGNKSNLQNYDAIQEDFKLTARRMARILSLALGRQDPLARWCNAIWIALDLLVENSDLSCRSSIGKSIVAFKLFADSRALDETTDEKATVRLSRNADEARLVRGGEISGRRVSTTSTQSDHSRINEILDSPPDEFPNDLEFDWWQEHYVRNVKPPLSGLGDLVQSRIDDYGTEDAKSSFTKDLKEGLNSLDVSAAEAVLANQHVLSSLNKSLRTKLENLVNPQVDATTGNFFAELQQILAQLVKSPRANGARTIHLSLEKSNWPTEVPSRETVEGFLYLYISPLEAIAAAETSLGNINISQLKLDFLILLGHIDAQDDEIFEDQLDDIENQGNSSEPAASSRENLAINIDVDGEKVQQISWSPVQWEADSIPGSIQKMLQKATSLGEHALHELADLYFGFFETDIKLGMPSAGEIDGFCSNWSSQIRKNRQVFATSRSACELVLSLHTERVNSDLRVMFTHPERLRWLRKYLDRAAIDIVDTLNGSFHSNPGNPGRYLDWMRERTPVGIPAFSHGSNIRECLLPTVEGPLNSTYENILNRSHKDTQIPARFVNRIARVASNFLDTYPFKKDRLSVAVFESSSADPISASLVEQILKANSDLQLSCDVFCQSDWKESILNNFTSNSVIANHNLRNQSRNSLKPPFELRLLNGTIDDLPEFDPSSKYDLILLIDFFSQTPEATKKIAAHQSGNDFDCLIDDSTHWFFLNTDPIQFVKQLLPIQTSSVLQEWSTLSIWVTENGPAQVDNYDLTEFIQIQTGFNSQVSKYKQIHNYSNWVISLDQVLGRQQFETIPEPPEVLQIVQDLGVNASHTMIVSSSENRGVIKRIERNIRAKAPSFSSNASKLAQAAYETARELSPRQILSSGGESSTYLEVLGLAASYVYLSSAGSIRDAWELWLSFDDMTDWFEFGGHSQRPDLLKISAHKINGELHIDFVIVECKQREAMGEVQLTNARKQALKGRDFINSIIQSPEMNDNWMWKSDLASVLPSDHFERGLNSVGAIKKIGMPDFELNEIAKSLRNGLLTTTVSAALVRVGFAITEISDSETQGVRMIKIPLEDVLTQLSNYESGSQSGL